VSCEVCGLIETEKGGQVDREAESEHLVRQTESQGGDGQTAFICHPNKETDRSTQDVSRSHAYRRLKDSRKDRRADKERD